MRIIVEAHAITAIYTTKREKEKAQDAPRRGAQSDQR
jgi:hypothetical protein